MFNFFMRGILLMNSIVELLFLNLHLKSSWIWWSESFNRLSNKPVRWLQTFIVLFKVSTTIWLWKETSIFALVSTTISVVCTLFIINKFGQYCNRSFDYDTILFVLYIYYITLIFLERWVFFQKLIQPYTIMSSVMYIWNIWISTNNVLWI